MEKKRSRTSQWTYISNTAKNMQIRIFQMPKQRSKDTSFENRTSYNNKFHSSSSNNFKMTRTPAIFWTLKMMKLPPFFRQIRSKYSQKFSFLKEDKFLWSKLGKKSACLPRMPRRRILVLDSYFPLRICLLERH